MQNLTKNEQYILDTVRSLKPFEKIEITADKNGKIDSFIVIRTRKVILTDNNIRLL